MTVVSVLVIRQTNCFAAVCCISFTSLWGGFKYRYKHIYHKDLTEVQKRIRATVKKKIVSSHFLTFFQNFEIKNMNQKILISDIQFYVRNTRPVKVTEDD